MNHPFRNIFLFIVCCSVTYMVGIKWSAQNQTAALAIPQTVKLPTLKIGAPSDLNLSAREFLSAYVAPDGTTDILVEKNGHDQVPIASVTKLMTALVAVDNLNLDATTTLASGKIFTASTLLKAMLVESNNDSANALARLGGGKSFVSQMNQVAKSLGMAATYYANSSGLDEPGGSNFSSADDLLTLTKKILNDQPEILAITRQQAVAIKDANGKEDHLAKTTNELLGVHQPANWPAEIIGGKTGTTPLAKTNLVLVLADKETGGHLINIVLGSEDHFGDMTKLTTWVYQNYTL